MDWLLTDEEIANMVAKVVRRDGDTGLEYGKAIDRTIARAAAREVAKWLFSPCKEHHLNNSTPPLRIDCYICRKDFEQEVGL